MKNAGQTLCVFFIFVLVKPIINIFISFSVIFCSCTELLIPHGSQVASPYEPVLLKKKKDIQASVGFRPIKYLNANFGIAPINNLAIQTNLGGFFGLFNSNGSIIYFNTFKKLNYFIGPIYNYQSNQIKHTYGDFSGTFYRSYHYSCKYQSPGLVCGFSFSQQNNEHHFNLKSLYNIVTNYNYYYLQSDRYSASIDETLNYKIPNFFTLEPSYSFIHKIEYESNRYFKIQIGFNVSQIVLKNHYATSGYTFYGYQYQLDKIYKHPRSWPINISFAYVFCSKK